MDGDVPDDGRRRILRVAVGGGAEGSLDWLRPKDPPPPPARREVDLDAFLAARNAPDRPDQDAPALREAVPDPERPAEAEPSLSWPPPREELEALVARGLSNREIGELYGVPRDTVAWRLSRLGIRRSAAGRQALQQRGGRKAAAKVHAERQAEPPPDQGAPELDPDRALELFFRSLARAAQLAQAMGVAMEVSVRVGRAS